VLIRSVTPNPDTIQTVRYAICRLPKKQMKAMMNRVPGRKREEGKSMQKEELEEGDCEFFRAKLFN